MLATIGGALVEWLQAAARHNQRGVRLHVAPDNRARRFYKRLGFQLIEDRGSNLFMEWRAVAKELARGTASCQLDANKAVCQ